MATQLFVCCAFPSNICQKSQAVTFLRGSFCVSPTAWTQAASCTCSHALVSEQIQSTWMKGKGRSRLLLSSYSESSSQICAHISSLELYPMITHSLKQVEIHFTVLPYTLYDKGRQFNKRSPQYIPTSGLGSAWRNTSSSPSPSVCFFHTQLFSLRIYIQKQ